MKILKEKFKIHVQWNKIIYGRLGDYKGDFTRNIGADTKAI